MKFGRIKMSAASIWAKNMPRAILALATLTLFPATAQAQAASDAQTPSLTLYGSLRVQAMVATVDEATDGKDDTEFGLWDAYSRVGAAVDFGLGETEITTKLELGLNTADGEFGDPAFFDDEDLRVYSLKAKGDWGQLTVGKDWLPYYNTVGYPVDYFSSLQAGYTTFAFFRERQIAYTTPNIGGVTATLAAIERTGGGPSGLQGTVSYSQNGLTLGAGFEEIDRAGVADTRGASISYTTGPWYLAAKIEDQDGQGTGYNGFVQRSLGKWTLKAGGAWGDQYSDDTYHLGVDYAVADNWKLFAEAYSEQGNYALLFDGADDAGDYLGAGGFAARQNGKALLLGLRHDFSTTLR